MTPRGIRCVMLAVVALAAMQATVVVAAKASDRHPWCLVVQDWGDGWACGYDTFAQCEAEARAGNVGYCAANPAYRPPTPARRSHPRRQPR